MRAFNILLTLLLSVGLWLPQPLKAHEGVDDGHSHATTAPADKDYVLITPVNGSLSEVVRKALQLFDQDNNNVTLTPAQAVAAETAIVQLLGGRLLEVNERVTVTGKLLQEQVAKAQALDAASLTEWQLYAAGTDFDTSHVRADTPAQADNNTPANPQTPPEAVKPDEAQSEAASETQPETADKQDRNSTYWLLLPLAVAALALVVSRSNKSTPAPPEPALTRTPRTATGKPKARKSRKK